MRHRMGHNKTPFIIASLVVALAGYYFFGGKNNKTPPAPPSVSVTTTTVLQQDMPNIITLVGTVYAYETVAVKSRLDSQVTAVHFKDGDAVKEGTALFQLDDSVLKAQLNQYEANLRRDEAQLDNAQAQYVRYQNLAKKGFASKEKMEDAQATYKTQEAAVNATKASIDSVKSQLAFTTIKAPISGRAGTINVTRGNNVKANDTAPMVTINQVSPIRVQFAIPQRYYDALRAASNSTIAVQTKRSDGQDLATGKLEYIDNNIDTATGSFVARAAFENADEKLWPGMFVNVSILLNMDKDALVIPQVAIQNNRDESFVYAVDSATKKAVKKPVEVLRVQDNNAIIKSGLNAGESVVIDGLLKISDGALVEISTPDNKSADKVEKK